MAASTIDNVLKDILPLFGVDKLKDEQRTINPKRVDKTKLTKKYISQLFRRKHPCG
jgi:F0F1-type ATP synthase beta subunit